MIGSVAFVAVARVILIVCRDPEVAGRRLVFASKSNLGPDSGGLGFRIETKAVTEGIVAPLVVWDGLPVTISATEALNAMVSRRDAPARDDAKEFLLELLSKGPVPARDVESTAASVGLSARTLRRAREELNILTEKVGVDGGWRWRLPD